MAIVRGDFSTIISKGLIEDFGGKICQRDMTPEEGWDVWLEAPGSMTYDEYMALNPQVKWTEWPKF